jgi:hypothetical protein
LCYVFLTIRNSSIICVIFVAFKQTCDVAFWQFVHIHFNVQYFPNANVFITIILLTVVGIDKLLFYIVIHVYAQLEIGSILRNPRKAIANCIIIQDVQSVRASVSESWWFLIASKENRWHEFEHVSESVWNRRMDEFRE